jgi:uncharacterized protein (DUF2062 family)
MTSAVTESSWGRRLWQRVTGPIVAQIKQGLSPDKAAWAVAVGLYLTVIPALGTTTALCLAAGFVFRLNHGILQSVSWTAYPLQFILLYPFFEAGAWAFKGPHMTLSPSEFAARAASDPLGLASEFWWIGMHAIGVWAVLGLVIVPLLWLGFHFLFARMASRLRSSEAV